MKKQFKKDGDNMKLNNKGFTLIELLAVLVILTTIMGLAIPSFSSSLERSKSSKEEQKKGRIISAAEIYVTDNKEAIYSTTSEFCNIRVDILVKEGYVDDEDNSNDYVKYTKPNTYEYVSSNEVINSQLCSET